MIKKRSLLNQIGNISNTVNELQAQIYELKYPDGNLEFISDWMGAEYLRYTYVYNNKIIQLKVRYGYGIKGYKLYKDKERALIGVKVNINDELKEFYYVVDFFKEVSVETIRLEKLNDLNWTEF